MSGLASLLILVIFPYGQGSVQIKSNLKQSASGHDTSNKRASAEESRESNIPWDNHLPGISLPMRNPYEQATDTQRYNYLPLIRIFNRLQSTKRLLNPTHIRVPPCNQNVARSIIRPDRLGHAFHFLPLAVCVNRETKVVGKR